MYKGYEKTSERSLSRVALHGQIVALHNQGLDKKAISNQLGISRPTVATWIKRDEDGEHMSSRPRFGRPRISTVEEDRLVISRYQNFPLII